MGTLLERPFEWLRPACERQRSFQSDPNSTSHRTSSAPHWLFGMFFSYWPPRGSLALHKAKKMGQRQSCLQPCEIFAQQGLLCYATMRHLLSRPSEWVCATRWELTSSSPQVLPLISDLKSLHGINERPNLAREATDIWFLGGPPACFHEHNIMVLS